MTDVLDQWHYFVSPIYSIKKPEFLKDALDCSKAAVKKFSYTSRPDEIYPVVQVDVGSEEKMQDMLAYTINTAWNLLDSQGYNMTGLSTQFTEIWCQSHKKSSSMDYHVHGDSVMSAFYFLECPVDCPNFVIHDPRPGKVMSKLVEKNYEELTQASNAVVFKPEPGTLIFANSWLPHSFTRNRSKEPFMFIHMNIDVKQFVEQPQYEATAEIV